jgi:multiple antibiotic resistance protein
MIFTIQAFVTFFTIIDPLGLVPVVISLTAQQSDVQRRNIITRAVVISAAIIAFFAWWVASCLIALGLASTPLIWLVVPYSSF